MSDTSNHLDDPEEIYSRQQKDKPLLFTSDTASGRKRSMKLKFNNIDEYYSPTEFSQPSSRASAESTAFAGRVHSLPPLDKKHFAHDTPGKISRSRM